LPGREQVIEQLPPLGVLAEPVIDLAEVQAELVRLSRHPANGKERLFGLLQFRLPRRGVGHALGAAQEHDAEIECDRYDLGFADQGLARGCDGRVVLDPLVEILMDHGILLDLAGRLVTVVGKTGCRATIELLEHSFASIGVCVGEGLFGLV